MGLILGLIGNFHFSYAVGVKIIIGTKKSFRGIFLKNIFWHLSKMKSNKKNGHNFAIIFMKPAAEFLIAHIS